MENGLTRSTGEVNDGANSQGTTGTQSTTNDVKTKGHIVIPFTHRVSAKALKRSVGGMVWQTHFKGSSTIKNLLVSSKDKDPHGQQNWGHILVPVWWPYLWWWIHMGKPPGPSVKDSKNIWNILSLYIIIAVMHRSSHHPTKLPNNREGGEWLS